jgi:hypothetical protein
LHYLCSNKTTDSFGKRYVAINEACHKIAEEIKQPLSLVDAMFSLMVHGPESPLVNPKAFDGQPESEGFGQADAGATIAAITDSFVFPLEKYLEDFLVSNWEKTALGKTLVLHARLCIPEIPFAAGGGSHITATGRSLLHLLAEGWRSTRSPDRDRRPKA